MRTFYYLFAKKRLKCYKIVYVPSVQKAPGPRTLFSLAPSSLGRTKYLGLWAHLPTRHIYNYIETLQKYEAVISVLFYGLILDNDWLAKYK